MSGGKFTASSPVLTGDGGQSHLPLPQKDRRRSSGGGKTLASLVSIHSEGGAAGRRESHHHRGSLADKVRSR